MIEENEIQYLKSIQTKDSLLRNFLSFKPFPSETLFQYLSEINPLLGNHHNDISFESPKLQSFKPLLDKIEVVNLIQSDSFTTL